MARACPEHSRRACPEHSRRVHQVNVSQMWGRVKRSAAVRGIGFDLTPGDLERIALRARGHCEVTGLAFRLAPAGAGRARPFAPSLDRIDSRGDYTFSNCRLVCVAVNYAMHAWGEEVLFMVARALVERGVV